MPFKFEKSEVWQKAMDIADVLDGLASSNHRHSVTNCSNKANKFLSCTNLSNLHIKNTCFCISTVVRRL